MIETEVKFALATLADIQARLSRMGIAPPPRQFERNRVFDTPDGRLQRTGQLLRLREDDQIRLTHKSPMPQASTEAKQMMETELLVSDASQMAKILSAMGYTTVRIYEKYRQVVHLADVHICLDILPFGQFVELEGAIPDISAMASRLALPWKDRILDNYLALFAHVKTRLGLDFENITFADFEHLDTSGVDFSGLTTK